MNSQIQNAAATALAGIIRASGIGFGSAAPPSSSAASILTFHAASLFTMTASSRGFGRGLGPEDPLLRPDRRRSAVAAREHPSFLELPLRRVPDALDDGAAGGAQAHLEFLAALPRALERVPEAAARPEHLHRLRRPSAQLGHGDPPQNTMTATPRSASGSRRQAGTSGTQPAGGTGSSMLTRGRSSAAARSFRALSTSSIIQGGIIAGLLSSTTRIR